MEKPSLMGKYKEKASTAIQGKMSGLKCYAYAYQYFNTELHIQTKASPRVVIETSASETISKDGDYQFPNKNRDNQLIVKIPTSRDKKLTHIRVFRTHAADTAEDAKSVELYALTEVENLPLDPEVSIRDDHGDDELHQPIASAFKLTSDANLSGQNLSGADLGQADLRNSSMLGADLHGIFASDTRFTGSRMNGADLSDAQLIGADLSQVEAKGTDFQRAVMRTADLSEADLSDADLEHAVLLQANLENAKCNNANLANANLREADLSGADFRGADLSGADLTDSIRDTANFEGVDMTSCIVEKEEGFFGRLFHRKKKKPQKDDD